MNKTVDEMYKRLGRRDFVTWLKADGPRNRVTLNKRILSSANLHGAVLRESNFSESILSKANFSDGDLSGSDMSYCIIRKANFRKANLAGVDFTASVLRHANLRESLLVDANLTNTCFSGADLRGADLTGAVLNNTKFLNANMTGVKGLIHVHLDDFDAQIQKEKTQIGCMYESNEFWLNCKLDDALSWGIKAEHFEYYKEQIRLGMELL